MLKYEGLCGALRLPFHDKRARRADGSFVDEPIYWCPTAFDTAFDAGVREPRRGAAPDRLVAAAHERLAYDVPQAAVVYF